jgi:murein DD-endopeptidase MepM/ murein hydrolase activator NlpD
MSFYHLNAELLLSVLRDKIFRRAMLALFVVWLMPHTGVNFNPFFSKASAAIANFTSGYVGGYSGDYISLGNGMGGAAISGTPYEAEMELALQLSSLQEEPEYVRRQMLTFDYYTIERGDIIGQIAARAGLNEDTLISANNIRNTRLLQIGQVLKIPNQDGIFYTVKASDTLTGIAIAHSAEAEHIQIANEMFSDTVTPGSTIFVPGGRMDWVNRQEINGDLFIWPTAGRITSPYGFRRSPFTGARQFHTGIDIGAPQGTPIRAAMSGRVSHVGFNNVFGNFVIINHHSGYRTLYGHMSVVRTVAGANVATGERIGDVGNTGLSTAPHLHFTVYKNGATVNPRTLMR